MNMAMSNEKKLSWIFTLVFTTILSLVASANIDCDGKSFHCVNSTHFMICVDLGGGVSSTIGNFLIPCPLTTECRKTNRFECELPKSTITAHVEVSVPSGIELIETTTVLSHGPAKILQNAENFSVAPLITTTKATQGFSVTDIPELTPQVNQNVEPAGIVGSRKDVEFVTVSTIQNSITENPSHKNFTEGVNAYNTINFTVTEKSVNIDTAYITNISQMESVTENITANIFSKRINETENSRLPFNITEANTELFNETSTDFPIEIKSALVEVSVPSDIKSIETTTVPLNDAAKILQNAENFSVAPLITTTKATQGFSVTDIPELTPQVNQNVESAGIVGSRKDVEVVTVSTIQNSITENPSHKNFTEGVNAYNTINLTVTEKSINIDTAYITNISQMESVTENITANIFSKRINETENSRLPFNITEANTELFNETSTDFPIEIKSALVQVSVPSVIKSIETTTVPLNDAAKLLQNIENFNVAPMITTETTLGFSVTNMLEVKPQVNQSVDIGVVTVSTIQNTRTENPLDKIFTESINANNTNNLTVTDKILNIENANNTNTSVTENTMVNNLTKRINETADIRPPSILTEANTELFNETSTDSPNKLNYAMAASNNDTTVLNMANPLLVNPLLVNSTAESSTVASEIRSFTNSTLPKSVTTATAEVSVSSDIKLIETTTVPFHDAVEVLQNSENFSVAPLIPMDTTYGFSEVTPEVNQSVEPVGSRKDVDVVIVSTIQNTITEKPLDHNFFESMNANNTNNLKLTEMLLNIDNDNNTNISQMETVTENTTVNNFTKKVNETKNVTPPSNLIQPYTEFYKEIIDLSNNLNNSITVSNSDATVPNNTMKSLLINVSTIPINSTVDVGTISNIITVEHSSVIKNSSRFNVDSEAGITLSSSLITESSTDPSEIRGSTNNTYDELPILVTTAPVEVSISSNIKSIEASTVPFNDTAKLLQNLEVSSDVPLIMMDTTHGSNVTNTSYVMPQLNLTDEPAGKVGLRKDMDVVTVNTIQNTITEKPLLADINYTINANNTIVLSVTEKYFITEKLFTEDFNNTNVSHTGSVIEFKTVTNLTKRINETENIKLSSNLPKTKTELFNKNSTDFARTFNNSKMAFNNGTTVPNSMKSILANVSYFPENTLADIGSVSNYRNITTNLLHVSVDSEPEIILSSISIAESTTLPSVISTLDNNTTRNESSNNLRDETFTLLKNNLTNVPAFYHNRTLAVTNKPLNEVNIQVDIAPITEMGNSVIKTTTTDNSNKSNDYLTNTKKNIDANIRNNTSVTSVNTTSTANPTYEITTEKYRTVEIHDFISLNNIPIGHNQPTNTDNRQTINNGSEIVDKPSNQSLVEDTFLNDTLNVVDIQGNKFDKYPIQINTSNSDILTVKSQSKSTTHKNEISTTRFNDRNVDGPTSTNISQYDNKSNYKINELLVNANNEHIEPNVSVSNENLYELNSTSIRQATNIAILNTNENADHKSNIEQTTTRINVPNEIVTKYPNYTRVVEALNRTSEKELNKTEINNFNVQHIPLDTKLRTPQNGYSSAVNKISLQSNLARNESNNLNISPFADKDFSGIDETTSRPTIPAPVTDLPIKVQDNITPIIVKNSSKNSELSYNVQITVSPNVIFDQKMKDSINITFVPENVSTNGTNNFGEKQIYNNVQQLNNTSELIRNTSLIQNNETFKTPNINRSNSSSAPSASIDANKQHNYINAKNFSFAYLNKSSTLEIGNKIKLFASTSSQDTSTQKFSDNMTIDTTKPSPTNFTINSTSNTIVNNARSFVEDINTHSTKTINAKKGNESLGILNIIKTPTLFINKTSVATKNNDLEMSLSITNTEVTNVTLASEQQQHLSNISSNKQLDGHFKLISRSQNQTKIILSDIHKNVTKNIIAFKDIASIKTGVTLSGNFNESFTPQIKNEVFNITYTKLKSSENVIINPSALKSNDSLVNNVNTSKTLPHAEETNLLPTHNNHIENKTKLLDFDCQNRKRGRYSDKKDCSKFYVCFGRVEPVIGKCPDNTVFSDITKQCTKNLAHCTKEREFKCTTNGRFCDILDGCTYYICVRNGNSFVRFKFQCQNGYYLDKKSVKCIKDLYLESQNQSSMSTDNSDSEKSNTDEVNSKTGKENNASIFKCEEEGKFEDVNDCRSYFVCTKNKKSEFRRKKKKCNTDEVFHKDEKKCVDDDSYDCE